MDGGAEVGESITVVMPVRNGEGTVRRAVTSALADLPRDSRVIVRNDGSTDATAAVLASITDRRLLVLPDSSPIGMVASRNALLDAVETPLVATMDADDVSLPGRLRLQAAAAEHCDLVFANVARFRTGVPAVKVALPTSISPELAPIALLASNPFYQPTLVARTDLLRALGGYRECLVEDYDLWLRAAEAGFSISRLARIGVLYRRHSGQATASAAFLNRAATDDPIVKDAYVRLLEREIGAVAGGGEYFHWVRRGSLAGSAPDGARDIAVALERRVPGTGLVATALRRRFRRISRAAGSSAQLDSSVIAAPNGLVD